MFNFEALEMISAEPAGVGSLICKNFISYGLYIACIVMGATYKNATCNEDLALWNIVFGAAGTFVTSIMIAVQYFTTRGTLISIVIPSLRLSICLIVILCYAALQYFCLFFILSQTNSHVFIWMSIYIYISHTPMQVMKLRV